MYITMRAVVYIRKLRCSIQYTTNNGVYALLLMINLDVSEAASPPAPVAKLRWPLDVKADLRGGAGASGKRRSRERESPSAGHMWHPVQRALRARVGRIH